FRPVLTWNPVSAAPTPSPSVSPAPSEEPAEPAEPSDDPAEPTESAEPSPSAEPSATPTPTDASDHAWITEELFDEFTNFTCASVDEATMAVAPADEPLITCDDLGQIKYLLGPVDTNDDGTVELTGEHIADATADLVMSSTGVS